jgi:putative phosphoribosyl transferase
MKWRGSCKRPSTCFWSAKIGVPGYPELALGAVLDGEHPHLVLNPDLAELASVDARYIAEQEAIKLKEIEDRRALYLQGRRRPPVPDRTVIVVDDAWRPARR